MIAYYTLGFALLGRALAQSFISSTDLTPDGLATSSIEAEDSLLALDATSDGNGILVPPTQTITIIETTALSATSATSSIPAAVTEFSYSPSGTLQLVTDASNVLLSTVESIGTPTPPATSTNGDMDGDRVAVIALASVLGALIIGLAILIPVLVRRRRARQTAPKHVPTGRDGADNSRSNMRQLPNSWLTSFRRSYPSIRISTAPQQQYATAPSQPLMSEGSPIYGFHSPHEARPAPLFSGSSRNRHMDSLNHSTRKPGTQMATADDKPLDTAASPLIPISAVTTRHEYQDPDHARHSSEHDAGNPYVDANPKTPRLHQDRPAHSEEVTTVSQNVGGHSHQAPLTSHPTAHTGGARHSNALEVPADSEDRHTERSSSIPRAGFADAIAGLGIDPDKPEEDHTLKRPVGAEPATTTTIESRGNKIVPGIRSPQPKNSSSPVSNRESRARASRVPLLKIPQSLMPGRQASKKTRFSIAGKDDVSPTSESWLDGDDIAQGHYRRPSTVSPISPERNDRRVRSELLAQRRSTRRGHRESLPGTMSAPAASSQVAAAVTDWTTGKDGKATLIPGVHHIQQKEEHPEEKLDSSQVYRPQHATATTPTPIQSVKRKPVPLDLATLVRKPLPPHPIPTSKYNQNTRQSMNSQSARMSTQKAGYVSQYESPEDMSSKLQGSHPSGTNQVAVPIAYTQAGRGVTTSTQTDRAQGQAPRPLSEAVGSNIAHPGYTSQSSRGVSMPMPAPLHFPQQSQPGGNGYNKRDTVQFFDDPVNQEHAQLYGSYYAQPSPVQFASPTSPHGPRFPYQPVAPYGYLAPPQHQYHPPQQYQEHPRYLQPPFQHQQQQQQVQARPHNNAGYLQPQPPVASASKRLSRIQEVPTAPTKSATAPSAWHDSQQDAWRDSLSRSGSDPVSNSGAASVTGVATSNASSGGGGGPGLWGSPGFFGVER